jgi:serine/threonine-protein kinase
MSEMPRKIGSLVPTRISSVPGADGSFGRRSRCPIDLVAGTGDSLTRETVALLHMRLGIASLIALMPFTLFLLLNMLRKDMHAQQTPLGLVLETLTTGVVAAVAAYLWSGRCLRGSVLRGMELLLFGTIGLYFGWTQFMMLSKAPFLDWARTDPAAQASAANTAVSSSAMRWFFLIVLYGVFIPNTWKRAAVLTGLAALTPVTLTLGLGLSNAGLRPYLLTPLLVMSLVLSAAVAIAVFGSHRIQYLEEEASQARKLGQYRLHDRLGTGGMGEVYLAEHTLLRRPCAIKVIHPDRAADPTQLSRFEREVRAMATLTHWNTVEVFDYGHTEDGTFYYVMEYLPGQNLEKLVLGNGPLPPGRVVQLLRQVCRALREAHATGLLHRDIKPSNIIACERGGTPDVVKLLDFGLVHGHGLEAEAAKLTMQGTILGSPPYMSPEQSRGRSDLDRRSDIYSVGGVAYFLLTGRPPFVRETVMELLIAHASERVAPPRDYRPDIPADLEAVVLRCLEKEPEKRYPTADALEKALAACACAKDWTEEMAAAWWREHGETVGVQAPESASSNKTTSVAVSA